MSSKNEHFKTKPMFAAVALFSIYSMKLKTYVHTKTFTQTFIGALFIVAKIWKQPRGPSVGEWVKNQPIHTMEHI